MKKKSDSQWETAACNLCGSNNYKIIYESALSWLHPGKYTIVSCTTCGLVFLNPRPKARFIGKYYQPDFYWGESLIKSTKKNFHLREKAYGDLYKQIFGMVRKGSILDIGAGTGLFLTRFKEAGWKVKGVELSKDACSYAEKVYGIKLSCGDFLSFHYENNIFDVVTLNNCLEHLHRPLKTIENINSVLKDDGILIITVPNFDSLGSKIFRDDWYALQPPTHLYHYNPSSLYALLNKAGFSIKLIRHDNVNNNYYVFFESMRLALSPRFKAVRKKAFLKDPAKKQNASLIFGIKKTAAKTISYIIALAESLFVRGEIITVYAKKS